MGKPSKAGTKMPRVHMNWDTAPRGPFISVGAASLTKVNKSKLSELKLGVSHLLYLGQKTVKAPAAIPQMNLPKKITYMLSIRQMPQPARINTFVSMIMFHLP